MSWNFVRIHEIPNHESSAHSDNFYFWHPMLLSELISISNMGVSLMETCFCSRLYGNHQNWFWFCFHLDDVTTTPEDITTTTPEDVTTLPDGCLDYFLLSDPERNKNHGYDGIGLCDYSGDYPYPSPDWQGPRWYKALLYGPTSEPSKIPEDIVYGNHCNAAAAGWLNGTHPTLFGQTVLREVCFHYSNDYWGGICAWSTYIQILNCGEYFLYDMVDVPYCSSRYCFE